MRIDIVTLFPGMVEPVVSESILGRARTRGLVDIRVVNLRDYAEGKHRVTDDYQFGGGGGMVLKPEPLGADGAAERESFASGLLEPPQYTRPEEFRGARVPAVLLSGDHPRIARWRRMQALWLTWKHRPDLLATATLDAADRGWIERFERGETPPSDEAP